MQHLEQLKKSLLENSQVEERVEVNQRHLIDKILARYSAEHTIFRELLQNSNDADARDVEIHFTTAKRPSAFQAFNWLKPATVESVVYKNNGRPFSEQDFARLRKIAEGNPDEQKIGFFGVGFYSLFSICEEPFVTSGSETMGFFWRNDALFTKRGKMPPESVDQWTTFFMPTRDPIPIPDTNDFARFICTSMAFSTRIKTVSVFVDHEQLMRFDRKSSPARPLELPPNASYLNKSPNGFFKVDNISVSKVQLEVQIKKSYTVHMRTAIAHVSTNIPRTLVQEMNRTTKKNPPSTTELKYMLNNYDEYESSSQVIRESDTIFSGLIPGPDSQGNIFIGFPTHQTTGCSMHLAGHFIPTVERESIDFVDKILSSWNQELLAMAGIITRMLYDCEMSAIGELYSEMSHDQQSLEWMIKKASHTMRSFHFEPSTPSHIVASILKKYFLLATPLTPLILSSKGVLNAAQVRIGTPEIDAFIKHVPTVPKKIMDECSKPINNLRRTGVLIQVNQQDMMKELQQRSLDTPETIAFLKWLIHARSNSFVQQQHLGEWLRIVKCDGKPLDTIQFVSSAKLIPPDLPNLPTLLPFSISDAINDQDGLGRYLGWSQLKLIDWVQFIVNDPMFKTEQGLERIMQTISRHIYQIDAPQRVMIISLLQPLPCVLSDKGLIVPNHCYFQKVNLFEDLPKLKFRKMSEQFLKDLGVRETIDLQMFFDRINTLSWDQTQMIKFLASFQDKISEMEWKRLQASPLFLAKDLKQRFPASHLFVPTDTMIGFGLPVLEWKGHWSTKGEEGMFMSRLGLNSKIPLRKLLEKIADAQSHQERIQRLEYFVRNFTDYEKEYNPITVTVAFIPTLNGLKRPNECFLDPNVNVMGYTVAHPDVYPFGKMLRIEDMPPLASLLKRLTESPPNLEQAPEIFAFLSTKQHLFQKQHYGALFHAKFIPYSINGQILHSAPSTTYLSTDDSPYQEFFTTVDFGPPANAFLRACGVKERPSLLELTKSLIKAPQDFLNKLQLEKYLFLLRQIATSQELKHLSKDMKASAFCLGSKMVDGKEVYSLARASTIYLINDTRYKDICPQEHILETFYASLGSEWITQHVTETFNIHGSAKTTDVTMKLQQTITERAPLLTSQPETLKPNATQILNQLQVCAVDSIQKILRFKDQTTIDDGATCCPANKAQIPYLVIVQKFSSFEVASVVCSLILTKPIWKEFALFEKLLFEDLTMLKRHGFQVDRYFNLNQSKIDTENAQLEAQREDKRELLEHLLRHYPDARPEYLQDLLDRNWPTNRLQIERLLEQGYPRNVTEKQLTEVFPDADPDYIREYLRESKKDINEMVNDLAEHGYPQRPSVSQESFSEKMRDLSLKQPPGQTQRAAESQSKTEKGTESLRKTEKETDNQKKTGDFMNLFSQFTKNLGLDTKPAEPKMQSPQQLQQQLNKAISSSQPAGSDTIQGEIYKDKPTIENECRVMKDNDLIKKTDIQGIPFYIDRESIPEGNQLLDRNRNILNRFAQVLDFLSRVYNLPKRAVHMYFDKSGGTIAFNRARALFFNVRFYQELHYTQELPGTFTAGETPSCYYYWFMTFAHELGHHFEPNHNHHHEHWMSSFAENYMGNLFQMMLNQGVAFG
ncbi:hypothetical protein EDD86DRAFT_185483 [Gorgonomyces haynaldii]|nr:hypothetical protein EDD86DRAFT_185483 [Gorgonomyces haynaldii]